MMTLNQPVIRIREPQTNYTPVLVALALFIGLIAGAGGMAVFGPEATRKQERQAAQAEYDRRQRAMEQGLIKSFEDLDKELKENNGPMKHATRNGKPIP